MIAKYINPLIQFGYWSYDIIFIDSDNNIINRFSTMFYSQPTTEDFEKRVNEYNNVMELNYNITEIQLPI